MLKTDRLFHDNAPLSGAASECIHSETPIAEHTSSNYCAIN